MLKVARWAALIPLFIIPFLPLYVAGDMSFPFITGKAFLFRILVEIAAAGWIISMLGDKEARPKFSWTLLIYGAFVVWMFIADLVAINPHKAIWSNYERMDGWITIIHVFVFFLIASTMLATEKLRTLWWKVFLAGVAATCAVALLQVACAPTGCAIGNQVHFIINQGGLRVDSTFGNAIYFAVYLMFALGITLWQAVTAQGLLRYALYALAALEVVFLLLTASRGALIATMGAVVFAAVWSLWSAGPKARSLAIATLVGLVVVLSGFFLVRNSSFVQEQPVIARLASIYSIEGELKTRVTIWGMAFQGAAERPILGWGQEGFNYVFAKYYNPSLFAVEPYYDRAHNTYLDWLIAGGLPAVLLFLALLGSAVLALLRMPLGRIERLTLVSLLVGYGIQALVVFDNLFTYVPLAMILATAHAVSSRPVKSFEALPVVSEQGMGVVGAPVVAAVAVATIWLVNVPSMKAAQDLITAQRPATGGITENLEIFKETLADGSFASQEIREQFLAFSSRVVVEPSVPVQLRQQYFATALFEINQELARAPHDMRLLVQRAGLYRAAGAYPEALASLDAALAESPNKQLVYIDRGETLRLAGDVEGARAAFEKAYTIDTNFKIPLIYLAANQIYAKDVAGAEQTLQTNFGTTTVDHDVLWNAYATTERYEDLLVMQQLRVANSNGAPAQRFMLARVYVALGRLDDARAEIQATIDAHPEVAQDGHAFLIQLAAPAKAP